MKQYSIRHKVGEGVASSLIVAESWDDAERIADVLGGEVDGEVSFRACAKCGVNDEPDVEYWADSVE